MNATKGALVLDKDNAGVEAKKKFDENVKGKSRSIVRGFYWSTLGRIIGSEAGFELPVDLEYLYSEGVWDKAEREGWLEVVTNAETRLSKKKQSDFFASAMAGKQYDLFGGIDLVTDRRIKKQFTDKGKVHAARCIERVDDNLAREYLSQFELTIKDLLQHLFGNLDAH